MKWFQTAIGKSQPVIYTCPSSIHNPFMIEYAPVYLGESKSDTRIQNTRTQHSDDFSHKSQGCINSYCLGRLEENETVRIWFKNIMSMYDLEKVYLELLLAQAQAQVQAQNQNQNQNLNQNQDQQEQASQLPLPSQNQTNQSSQTNFFSQTQAQTQSLSSILSHSLSHGFNSHSFDSQTQSQSQASPQTRSLSLSHLFSQPQVASEPQPLSLAQLFSQSQSQQQQQQQQLQLQQQQQQQQSQPLTSLSDFFSQSQSQDPSQQSPRGESQQGQSQSNPNSCNTIFNWSITQHQLSLQQSQNAAFSSSQNQNQNQPSFLQQHQLPNLNSGSELTLTSLRDQEDPPQILRSAQDAAQMSFSNDWLSTIKFANRAGGSVRTSHQEDASEQISQQTASTVATASMGEGTSGEGMHHHHETGKSSSSRYESQKRRDWNTFGQYLKNHRPPIAMNKCTSQHVVEFLRYLDQFGKTKVHNEGCQFYGTSGGNPCGCPMKQAWGSLDSLVGRLRAAYEENGGKSENNPFGTRIVRTFLRDVREHQAKARGIAYEKKKRKRAGAGAGAGVLVGLGGASAAGSGGTSSASGTGGLGKIIQGSFKEM